MRQHAYCNRGSMLDRKVLEAVYASDEKAMATAFAAGASPNARTPVTADSLPGARNIPYTALSLAASRGDIIMVQALLKAGADVNDRIWDPSNARSVYRFNRHRL